MTSKTLSRTDIVNAAAELDTLSVMLGGANDQAVVDEVKDRLRGVLASLTPHGEGRPEDPML